MTSRATKITLAAVIVLIAGVAYIATSGLAREGFDILAGYVYTQQREFSRSLNAAVNALRDGRDGALMTLIGLGFTYGIFHAIGPGHGKAVITAYALTHETRLARTAAISFASALIQGGSAIVIVGALMLVLGNGLRRAAMDVDNLMTPLSFAAIMTVGIYLLLRGVRAAIRLFRPPHSAHQHEHGEQCGCGHAHIPTPQQVEDASTWRRGALVALAVGVRPCSGAILVLVLAFAFGFAASGIAAVLAMSLGTALTVSLLALTAQGLRWPLAKILTDVGVKSEALTASLTIIGGGVITVLGATLLLRALTTPAHPFF
ncbi:MAG: nickel/cobalt transporter [Rhodospirillales bacterium]|nr:nickel/cobalt transporter [Rhodospirillales bacterium]